MSASTPHLYAILLAAGEARRFGSTKQLEKFESTSLIGRALLTAENVCGPQTVTVLGHDALAVLREMQPCQGFAIVNDDYTEGLGTSIACGVRALPPTADAILILLADQPLVSASQLRTLIARWQGSPASIVASAYADTMGPPAIFPRKYFAQLQDLRGDKGARDLIQTELKNVLQVACETAALDIDTRDDLESMQ